MFMLNKISESESESVLSISLETILQGSNPVHYDNDKLLSSGSYTL